VKTFLNKNVEVALDLAELPLKGAGGAGLLVAAAYVMGAFGQVTGGRTLDRIAPDRSLAIYLFLAGAACFGMAAVSGPLVVLPAAAFAFFYFAGQPAGNELVARFIGPRWRGLGFGIHFTISFGLASVGSWVAGTFSQEGRMGELFALCGTILAMSSALVLALRPLSARGRAALEGASR
ncbi:MAG: hypothetical protein L0216_04660, partial [Planctomycetales bacterium]|nr:hypothetical protein [Planctomycetales bacterium]